MTKKLGIKIGDIFEIPLSDGRKAYGQYVYQNMGPIIRIFDYFTSSGEKPDLNKIDRSKLLFPPIHAAVVYAIHQGIWKIIGELPADDYVFKGFLGYSEKLPVDIEKGVEINMWHLWDGEKSVDIGEKLPEEYKDYETTAIYPPDLVLKRIETGFSSFDNPKKNNRFLTEKEVKRKLESN